MTKHAFYGWVTALALIILAFGPGVRTSVFAQTPAPQALLGYVPPEVLNGLAQDQGALDANTRINIAVALPVRNEGLLSQILAALQDPSSSSYHHFLTQDQANSLFNPTAIQEALVVGWLKLHGLTVTRTYPNHLLVDATGTAWQIESAFGIQEHVFHGTVDGKETTFYAPTSNPVVDSSVGGLVSAVVGLDDVPRIHKPLLTSNGSTNSSAPLYPQDFANAYDVNPLWAAGATGAGEHIGITLWGQPPSDASLKKFGTITGAAVATTANGKLKVIQVDKGTAGNYYNQIDDGEAGMDIEYSGALAPDATIDFYEAPTDSSGNPTDKGLADALNQAGTDSNDNRQITSSWGECEPDTVTDSFVHALEPIFASNSATGHTYLFASGDEGSLCNDQNYNQYDSKWPNYPTSSPNVLAVGGTTFSGSVSSSWPGEVAWQFTGCNSFCQNWGGSPEGSGGGYSKLFSKPSWEVGIGSATKRGYPDVSADADPNTGAEVCYGGNPATNSTGSCDTIGGTSLASPLWAGMLAVTNSYLAAQGKAYLGFVNPMLYTMATTTQPYPAFHDITSGTNGDYTAGAGWDPVTGWGSVDAYNFAQDAAGLAASIGTNTSGPPTTTTTTDTSTSSVASTETLSSVTTSTSTSTQTSTTTVTSTSTVTTTSTVTSTSTTASTTTSSSSTTSQQLIVNGGFESGTSPWSESSRRGREIIVTAKAHTGKASARLCGYVSCDDQIWQSLALPSAFSKATLSFWTFIQPGASARACYDYFYVRLKTSGGAVISVPLKLCNQNFSGWLPRTVDVTSALSSYTGQSVILQFEGTTSPPTYSTFYVDDATLTLTGVPSSQH